MKAVLIYYRKDEIQKRFVLELTIHEIPSGDRYPDGIKYGLLLLDKETGKRILMDNHHPKGHHIHIDESESSYHFKDVDSLIDDFMKFVFEHLGVRI